MIWALKVGNDPSNFRALAWGLYREYEIDLSPSENALKKLLQEPIYLSSGDIFDFQEHSTNLESIAAWSTLPVNLIDETRAERRWKGFSFLRSSLAVLA